MLFPTEFDVIVVGGGHAGTEAALASARMGSKTLLLTHNIETLGQMSCNPSIGGIGKGHLVKEVDALGGAMAAATDEGGIQFRILNSSKGPAVRATRAQADRLLYKQAIRHRLENQPNLWLFQQAVDDLIVEGDRVVGAVTQVGVRFRSRAVVLTAGTFLDGKIHVGLNNYTGGRAGDPAAVSLSGRLKELKLPQGRLKTGTPPRIDGRTIDYSKLEEQPGDLDPIPVFSFLGRVEQHPRQVPCWVTHTNARTHDIIRSGLDRSPMYTGVIEGVGPRYCPSIEDKIHRFASKDAHQIFLEPEGLTTNEFYPNGISTSLPFDVQLELVRSMVGLEHAHILRPGYAIEYDYFDPRGAEGVAGDQGDRRSVFRRADQRDDRLRRSGRAGPAGWDQRRVAGAGQGRMDARAATKPTLACWSTIWSLRAFPSRIECSQVARNIGFRLREDNADMRLTEIGRELGVVDDVRWDAFSRKRDAVSRETERLRSTWVNPKTLPADEATALLGKPIDHEYSLADLLRRPGVSYEGICGLRQGACGPETVLAEDAVMLAQIKEQIEIGVKYQGYIDRQAGEIERNESQENTRLPEGIDYARGKRAVIRGTTKADAAPAGNDRPGFAHFRHYAGCNLLADGAPETRARPTRGSKQHRHRQRQRAGDPMTGRAAGASGRDDLAPLASKRRYRTGAGLIRCSLRQVAGLRGIAGQVEHRL